MILVGATLTVAQSRPYEQVANMKLYTARGTLTPQPPFDFQKSLGFIREFAPVGIILSGTGSDGSVGIKTVKEEGGLLMVQSPEEAEYDGMPRAAIETGIIDVVLPVSELADTLMRYAEHPQTLPGDPDQLTPQQQETMQRILAHVNARTGHDFRQYKRTTILRRTAVGASMTGALPATCRCG